jgi:hypothetical protein
MITRKNLSNNHGYGISKRSLVLYTIDITGSMMGAPIYDVTCMDLLNGDCTYSLHTKASLVKYLEDVSDIYWFTSITDRDKAIQSERKNILDYFESQVNANFTRLLSFGDMYRDL